MYKYVKDTIIEYINNKNLVYKMAIERFFLATIRATGGIIWIYFHDLLYYFVYVCVRMLLYGSGKSEGISGVEFTIIGIVPWVMIIEMLNQSRDIIVANKKIISNIEFPVVILPGMSILSIFIKKLPTFIVPLIVLSFYRDIECFNIWLFLYMLFATLAFMFSYTMLFSAINAICDDFKQLYISVMRVIFFSVPVIWSMSRVNKSKYHILKYIIKANPLVYIIEGFRDAYVFGYRQSIRYTAYFWIVTIALLFLGCFFQQKLKRFYNDFI